MQGNKTHEQFERVIQNKEKTKGIDIDVSGDLKRAEQREDGATESRSQARAQPDLSTGDRSIQRGANQASEHHKERSDD